MIKIPAVAKTYADNFPIFASSDDKVMRGDETTEDYEVFISGSPCEVHSCRVSKMPFNREWPGKQRAVEQTEIASFISFSADEEAVLTVKCKREFKKAVVRPLSKGIVPSVDGDTVCFTIERCGQYVLELDNEHFALHIFVNPIKEYEKNATYYFGPGVHYPQYIELKDNDSVYVDDEAIVYTSIYANGAKNIHIYGGGILDNGCEERVFEHCYAPYTKGNIRLYNCENVVIEDVILRNSSTWVVSAFECENIKIDNIKIIGQWRYNTDGIDLVNTKDVTITNSFIRAFDDVITIKGIYCSRKKIENIVTDNCVLWCDWGRNCEVGIETAYCEYDNIVFKNSDLIHNTHVCMDIQNGDLAEIHNVTFENLNVEYQVTTQQEIYQSSDDMEYKPEKIGIPRLIWADNHMYARGKNCKDTEHFGMVHDILYKNINVFLEDGVPYPHIRIESKAEDFYNFTIDGLFVNGEKQTNLDKFETIIKNAKNVVVK